MMFNIVNGSKMTEHSWKIVSYPSFNIVNERCDLCSIETNGYQHEDDKIRRRWICGSRPVGQIQLIALSTCEDTKFLLDEDRKLNNGAGI